MSKRILLETEDGRWQLFENNECPTSFLNTLRKQGLMFDENTEDTFENFRIRDIQPILDEVKSIFLYKLEKNKKMVDFSKYFFDKEGNLQDDGLYMTCRIILGNSYLFDFYHLIEFLKPVLDLDRSFISDDKFILKEDAIVTVSMS